MLRIRRKHDCLGTGKQFYIYYKGWPLPCIALNLFTFDFI